jgi:hypothetical protein
MITVAQRVAVALALQARPRVRGPGNAERLGRSRGRAMQRKEVRLAASWVMADAQSGSAESRFSPAQRTLTAQWPSLLRELKLAGRIFRRRDERLATDWGVGGGTTARHGICSCGGVLPWGHGKFIMGETPRRNLYVPYRCMSTSWKIPPALFCAAPQRALLRTRSKGVLAAIGRWRGIPRPALSCCAGLALSWEGPQPDAFASGSGR